MTSKISMILEVLGDGKWHLLEEMRLQTGVTFEEMEEIVSFLCKSRPSPVATGYKKRSARPSGRRYAW